MSYGQISKWKLVYLWLILRKTVEEIAFETGVCKDSQKQARVLWDIPDKDDAKRGDRIAQLTGEYAARFNAMDYTAPVLKSGGSSLKVVAESCNRSTRDVSLP